MDFQNRVVVVTGGANGIGRATVESFLSADAAVAFVDTDKQAGEKIVSRFEAHDVYFHHGDIAEEAALYAFAEAVKHRFGKVDYLINNACISKKGILSECSYEDFNYVLSLGVTAPYLLTSLLLPVFTADASVVNIASSRGFMSQKDTESYSAAKGGILSLTHALSISLAGKVRVNSISPGWIDTGSFHEVEDYQPDYEAADLLQHPVGRVGVPDDIVQTIRFLCSGGAGFITGQNFTVDGGMSKLMVYHNDHGWTYTPESK